MTQPVGQHTDKNYMHNASWDVEQTRYPVCRMGVFTVLKKALIQKKPAIPLLEVKQKKENECCLLLFRQLLNVGIWNFRMRGV